MLKNYFTIAVRGIARNKSYAFINIAGLSLGITTCLIIFLIIRHELSFDSFMVNYDRIYRVVRDEKNSSGIEKSNVTPYPLGNAMRNDFPDIKDITQFHFQYKSLVTIDNEKSYVDNIVFADSSFFDVFGFEVVSGNPKKELAQPGKVFLTEEYAKKLPEKHSNHIKLNNLIELEVVGIIKTPSSPSHIAINMVASMPSLTQQNAKSFLGFGMDQWGLNSAGFTYIILPENMTKESVEKRMPAFLKKYFKPENAEKQTYSLQSLYDAHFNTEYLENPGTSATSVSTLWVLGAVALFILVIACVNFINLSTALSVRKSKEVGVRKTLGAQQSQLAFQYLSEALLLTFMAAILSVGMAEWAAPFVGAFLENKIALNLFHNAPLIVFLTATILFTALLSGFYPSMVLARFNPVKALRSRMLNAGNSSVSLRKILVILQFSIAQVLIICTLIVSSQLTYFRSKPLGFVKEAVINVDLPKSKPEQLESFRTRLVSQGHIQDVSFSLGAPIAENNFGTSLNLPEKGGAEKYSVWIKPVDIHYKDVYGLELIEGRWFLESEEKMADTDADGKLTFAMKIQAYVVNEATVKTLGFASAKDIIGKNITIGLNEATAPVVGVVKNFHTASLHSGITPVVLLSFPYFYYDAGIKIATADMPTTLKAIEKTWLEFYPDYLFKYTFLDQYVDRLYQKEDKMFKLFQVVAGIAIFIGCLGLYGLASFLANQKTKEVAIRKTLGASVSQIVALFSKEFIVLVALAFVFAAPVAWYSMKLWLQEFAYKVEMGWIVFVLGVAFTLFISLATVGYRSLRAAIANPVDALKSE